MVIDGGSIVQAENNTTDGVVNAIDTVLLPQMLVLNQLAPSPPKRQQRRTGCVDSGVTRFSLTQVPKVETDLLHKNLVYTCRPDVGLKEAI